MSDSEEDWEKNLDSDYEEEEKKKADEQAKKKAQAFDDEDKVDEEAKKKKLQEEARKAADAELEANKRTKKAAKIDYEEAFAKRQAGLTSIKSDPAASKEETKGMSKASKGIILEQEAEAGLADQLFGGMDEKTTISLNSEKEYKEFGRKTGKLLYQGSAPYRVENFFKELCKELPEHCDSKQIGKIVDHLTIMQKNLAKKEKEARDGKNKKSAKPSIKGAATKNDRNNNPAMINDMMGGGDAYGDYGDEAEGFKREEEADYDFM